MIRALAFSVLAIAACAPVTTTPAPEPPPPPVIGHWTLEPTTTSEHLWIEPAGTWSEAGDPLSIGFGSLTNTHGSWTFAAPDALTLYDVRTGDPHEFSTFFDGAALVLQSSPAHSYRFLPDAADGGADH